LSVECESSVLLLAVSYSFSGAGDKMDEMYGAPCYRVTHNWVHHVCCPLTISEALCCFKTIKFIPELPL
jgi:hypothetical protein